MNTQPMVSLKPHRYDRKDLRAQDRFDAKKADVKLLVGLGRAKVAPVEELETEPETQVNAPTASRKPQPANTRRVATTRKNSSNQRNRGRYNRRDQRAQD